MTQQHIDNDTLSLFVRTTSYADDSSMDSVQYHQVLDHLAHCEECRDQVSIITTLQNDLSQLPHESSLTDQQQQLICDYVDGHLSTEETVQARTLIDNQPEAMRAALHYQSHVEPMQSHIAKEYNSQCNPSDEPTNATLVNQGKPLTSQNSKRNYLNEILSFISHIVSMRSPMIYTMAATAVIFIAVFSLLQSPDINRKQLMIATYQDNATIQFTDKNKLPGVGFFSQSGALSKPFDDIKIELINDKTIKISWPEIDGAELYKMRLQVFNQGKKIMLKETSTDVNHATFQLENNRLESSQFNSGKVSSHNQRYEWVLYGNTIEDQMFYASGGFVINHIETDIN